MVDLYHFQRVDQLVTMDQIGKKSAEGIWWEAIADSKTRGLDRVLFWPRYSPNWI